MTFHRKKTRIHAVFICNYCGLRLSLCVSQLFNMQCTMFMNMHCMAAIVVESRELFGIGKELTQMLIELHFFLAQLGDSKQ